jgi:hypothetical protein
MYVDFDVGHCPFPVTAGLSPANLVTRLSATTELFGLAAVFGGNGERDVQLPNQIAEIPKAKIRGRTGNRVCVLYCRLSRGKPKEDRPNRRFKFHKRRKLFIRTHNETLSVAAISVNNPDRSPAGIHS